MNENVILDDDDQRIYLFLEELKDVAAQIERRLEPLRIDEYNDILSKCIDNLIESERREMQTACCRMILLIYMKRIDLENVEWELYRVETYERRLWDLLKEWSGIFCHATMNDAAWIEELRKAFEKTLNALCLIANMSCTDWSLSRWVNSIINFDMEYEAEDVAELSQNEEAPLNMREELERQLVVVEHQKSGGEHPTYYFCNAAFHTWQMTMMQDAYRSLRIIDSFSVASTNLQSEECASFMIGIEQYVYLALQNTVNHKECMAFLVDNWLTELSVPGLRGTSMTSTNLINKSVWKQILPLETAQLLTRIKDARLHILWKTLKDGTPYETCLRHAIFKKVLELTFSRYVPKRLLQVEQWRSGTIPDGQIFQHYGWWGVYSVCAASRVSANGWNAPNYVLYQWLKIQPSCKFHNDFIRMISSLREDTLTLPAARTEGALVTDVTGLPSYMIMPNVFKRRKIIV